MDKEISLCVKSLFISMAALQVKSKLNSFLFVVFNYLPIIYLRNIIFHRIVFESSHKSKIYINLSNESFCSYNYDSKLIRFLLINNVTKIIYK